MKHVGKFNFNFSSYLQVIRRYRSLSGECAPSQTIFCACEGFSAFDTFYSLRNPIFHNDFFTRCGVCIGTLFYFFTWFHVFSADSHVFRCLDIFFSYAHVFLGFSADGNVFLCFLLSIYKDFFDCSSLFQIFGVFLSFIHFH
jgi:hypothetical protein